MFPKKLLPVLEKVIAKAAGQYPVDAWPLTSSEQEQDDVATVKRALVQIGFDVPMTTAYAVWEMYSEDNQASWLDGADTEVGALSGIEHLCQNIADGIDYVGFSGFSK